MADKTKIEWTDASWQTITAAKRIGVSVRDYVSALMLGLKWCTRCKEWHPRAAFNRDRSRGDGLTAACSLRKFQREPTLEEKREQANTTYRAYYAGAGGPAIRAQKYARRRQCEPVEPHVRELVMEKFLERCAYCPNPATTVDHVIAITKGGDSRRGNLLPACQSCNSRKRTRSLDEFLSTCANASDLIVEELCMAEVLGG